MNNKFKMLFVFSIMLFVGLGFVSAVDVDASVDDVALTESSASPIVDDVVVADNIVYDDIEETEEVVPASFSSLNDGQTYSDSVITLSGDASYTDASVTFGDNVLLKSDDTKRTLNNLKIVVSGSNVTINNVAFNHQTASATKVIDVVGASDVLINNTDITLTKNNAVTTMAINIENNANGVVVNNSSIIVNGVAQTLWHQDDDGNWYDELMISGVNVDRASNVNVANSTVQMFNTTDTVSSGTTMPAVTVKNTANNIKVVNNTINSTGATYVYGVMCNDYVSSINISGNKVNVSGEIYTAGIDASTTINSYVYENKIIANTTNHVGFGYKQEALAYGIVLATYQTGNSNNNASYNNITLVANVAYGIENYLGSNNKIDFNNITIDAKRGLGIATNSSNSNYYRNNKINITCNQDNINVFDEAIPAQNVGIIVINGSYNTISNNHINITENVATTTAYAITLDTNSEKNSVTSNELYVYNTNGLTKSGTVAILNQGTANVISGNLPNNNQNSINSFQVKNIKNDDDTLIINKDNISLYGTSSGQIWVISKNVNSAHVIIDPDENTRRLLIALNNVEDIQLTSKKIYRIATTNNLINTYLPYCNIEASVNLKIINSTFLTTTTASKITMENSTILSLQEKTIALDSNNFGSYFNNNNNYLSDNVEEGTIFILRNENSGGTQSYTNPMIINKPVNITSFDNTIYNADITFVSGSEGSNITNMVLNGNLYINTSGITVKNNTINEAVIVKDANDVVIEENTFTTDTTAIEFINVLGCTVQNNNITTTSTYTITLDADCVENTITGNNLQAAELSGVESVLDEGEDNTITDGGDEPVIVEPVLKVDTTEFTIGETASIQASIYLGDEVATDINGGKVVFKVDGKTLKDANGKVIYAKVIDGVATTDYVIPTSWNKDDITIEAVYSGSKDCSALSSEQTPVTIVQEAEPTLIVDSVNSTAGSTVELKAKVQLGDNPITTGKIVFKINGKTVKDANGKVVYATVDANGEVSVDYVIPESMKAKTYTITAVFTSACYDKLISESELTVTS